MNHTSYWAVEEVGHVFTIKRLNKAFGTVESFPDVRAFAYECVVALRKAYAWLRGPC